MLVPLDDLLIHQSPRTLAYPATTDLRFFERFYFNIHDRSGEVSLVTGLGSYPNMNSMDGFACAVTKLDPHQYNARFFRELTGDRSDSHVGPLRFTVVEPMHRWTMALAPNPYDVEFEIEMETRFDPWETHLLYERGVSTIFDMGHFVQSCMYRGRIVIGGKSFELDNFLGVRDRSWGVRPLAGMPMPANSGSPYAMHFWFNAQFDDSTYFIFYVEDASGDVLKLEGGIAGGSRNGRSWTDLEYSLEFDEEIRTHVHGLLRATDDSGENHEIVIDRALPGIFLSGAGYGTTQGKFMGNHDEGERWDVVNAPASTLAQYGADGGIQDQLARFTLQDGTIGYGMMEYSFGPAYKRYPPRFEQYVARNY